MVPTKFFQQLLRNLDNPQPHAVRNQQHWRAPILCPLARKMTYCLFNLNTLKVALEEQVHWNGEMQVTDNLSDIEPREALAAAKNITRGKGHLNSKLLTS